MVSWLKDIGQSIVIKDYGWSAILDSPEGPNKSYDCKTGIEGRSPMTDLCVFRDTVYGVSVAWLDHDQPKKSSQEDRRSLADHSLIFEPLIYIGITIMSPGKLERREAVLLKVKRT